MPVPTVPVFRSSDLVCRVVNMPAAHSAVLRDAPNCPFLRELMPITRRPRWGAASTLARQLGAHGPKRESGRRRCCRLRCSAPQALFTVIVVVAEGRGAGCTGGSRGWGAWISSATASVFTDVVAQFAAQAMHLAFKRIDLAL